MISERVLEVDVSDASMRTIPNHGSKPSEPGQRETFRSLLTLALWFGLVVGLMEGTLRTVQRLVIGQWTFLSPHVVWMAPVADVCLYAIVALLLFLAGVLSPWLIDRPRVVFLFTLLGAIGPLMFMPGLHRAAAGLLAVGVAVQTTYLSGRYAHVFDRTVRRTTPALVVVVVLLGALVTAQKAIRERRLLDALPPSLPDRPNVVLIVLDTVRAANLGVYGYSRDTTPFLNDLARKGVVFERAISTSSWTLPSHAGMFTGRYPHELSANFMKRLDGRFPTLAERLRERGYLTAGFVANLTNLTYECGIDRGFIRYEDHPVSAATLLESSWLWRIGIDPIFSKAGTRRKLVNKFAEDLNTDVLRWLDGRGSSRPFFIFINYLDAHAPYIVPKTFKRVFGVDRPRPPLSMRRTWSSEDAKIELDAYDSAIAYLDQQLGVFFRGLERRGLSDNTLIIVTSDHGEAFGEHGLFGHGHSLYRPLLHVPFIAVLPSRIPAGLRVSPPITLRDLPATVMDLTGFDGRLFPGTSLRTYWAGTESVNASPSPVLSEIVRGIHADPWVPLARGDMRSLVLDGKHYIQNTDGGEELYDFRSDPEERVDLVRSVAPTGLLRFRAALESARKAHIASEARSAQ
jgi:arylsulfatase A-like enzyme